MAFVEELRSYSIQALYVPADVSQRAAVEAMADRWESEMGPRSILVSNA